MKNLNVVFYDINELPPKVSVKVDSLTVLAFNAPDNIEEGGKQAADITTSYDAILETNFFFEAFALIKAPSSWEITAATSLSFPV